MHDRGLVVGRQVGWQPFHQLVHRRDGLGFCRFVLFGPAGDLTRQISFGAAEIAQSHGLGLHRMQIGQSLDEAFVKGTALRRGQSRQAGVVKDPTFDHFHHVEISTDHRWISAEMQHLWHRDRRVAQGMHHPVFPIHRMGGRQQRSRGLLAQDVFAPTGGQLIGWIALARIELAHLQVAGKSFQMIGQIGL